MKWIALFGLLFTAACASQSVNQAPENATPQGFVLKEPDYKKIWDLQINKSTAQEVIATFGEPAQWIIDTRNHTYSMSYNDPHTGLKRVSMLFLANDDKLTNIFWLPQEDRSPDRL